MASVVLAFSGPLAEKSANRGRTINKAASVRLTISRLNFSSAYPPTCPHRPSISEVALVSTEHLAQTSPGLAVGPAQHTHTATALSRTRDQRSETFSAATAWSWQPSSSGSVRVIRSRSDSRARSSALCARSCSRSSGVSAPFGTTQSISPRLPRLFSPSRISIAVIEAPPRRRYSAVGGFFGSFVSSQGCCRRPALSRPAAGGARGTFRTVREAVLLKFI